MRKRGSYGVTEAKRDSGSMRPRPGGKWMGMNDDGEKGRKGKTQDQ